MHFILEKVTHKISKKKNLFSYYWHPLPFLFNIGFNSVLQKSLSQSHCEWLAILCIVAVLASGNSCLNTSHKEKVGASPESNDIIVGKKEIKQLGEHQVTTSWLWIQHQNRNCCKRPCYLKLSFSDHRAPIARMFPWRLPRMGLGRFLRE